MNESRYNIEYTSEGGYIIYDMYNGDYRRYLNYADAMRSLGYSISDNGRIESEQPIARMDWDAEFEATFGAGSIEPVQRRLMSEDSLEEEIVDNEVLEEFTIDPFGENEPQPDEMSDMEVLKLKVSNMESMLARIILMMDTGLTSKELDTLDELQLEETRKPEDGVPF